jgi:hypothetical protein
MIYGLGIPAGVLYLMRRDKDRLDTLIVKEKFGFLFNGFKRKYYYWEIVIMYRKVLMIFISVFLNQIGLIVQALVILIVLVFFIQVNNLKRPFSDRALNEIENISLLASTITIYCGIFFLSAKDPDSQSFDNNRDFSLNETGSIILFLLIVGSNLLFVLLWTLKFYVIVRENVRDKYPRLYIYIFLCCRKDRWVRENIQRAKNEKNESMIAKVEDIQYFMMDMKSMYIRHINYEGHDEFMKLLYIIEDMKPKIDMTIKKNEFKVDGKIARERRFDPEHLNNALDEKKLDVNEGFGSGGSYCNSESVEKKRGKSSSNHIENNLDKYIPESKDDLLSYFGTRKNISNINRDHNKIYNVLAIENKDYSPFEDPVEEEKMLHLEQYFQKKFKDPESSTVFKKSHSSDKTVTVSGKKSHRSQSQNDVSIEGEGNTTSHQLIMPSYNEYESDMGNNDNYMSKIKISRNAKILMRPTKEEPPGVDPKFNLPLGLAIQEEDLDVKDYDSDKGETASITKHIRDDTSAMNDLRASMMTSKVFPGKGDGVMKAKDDHRMDLGLRNLIVSSFPKNQHKEDMEANEGREGEESSKLDEELYSSSSSSSYSENSKKSSAEPSSLQHKNMARHKPVLGENRRKAVNTLQSPPDENPGYKRGKSKFDEIKDFYKSKMSTVEDIKWNNNKRKTVFNLGDIDLKVSEHRKNMANLKDEEIK